MAILNHYPNKPIIYLGSPQGNAFALIGQAETTCKQLRYSKEKTECIINDMQAGDYEHLISVFDSHFGDFFDLVRA